MKKLTPIITLFGLILFGCEQDSSDNNNGNDTEKIEVVTHDIDAANADGFYYDLVNAVETDSSEFWHLSFQMLPVVSGNATYMMPSLVLGEVLAAEYTNMTFEDMESVPDSFMEEYFQDPTTVQYGESNEVLSYDMQIHRVSVNNPDRVFVIYESVGQTAYKVQFIEYVSGVISFSFSKFENE